MGLEVVAPVTVERRGAHHRKSPEGEFGGQRGVRPGEIDPDGEIVDGVDARDGRQHPGERESPGGPPLEILLDRGGVERRAIMERDIRLKVQRQRQAVGGDIQGFCEPWNDPARIPARKELLIEILRRFKIIPVVRIRRVHGMGARRDGDNHLSSRHRGHRGRLRYRRQYKDREQQCDASSHTRHHP